MAVDGRWQGLRGAVRHREHVGRRTGAREERRRAGVLVDHNRDQLVAASVGSNLAARRRERALGNHTAGETASRHRGSKEVPLSRRNGDRRRDTDRVDARLRRHRASSTGGDHPVAQRHTTRVGDRDLERGAALRSAGSRDREGFGVGSHCRSSAKHDARRKQRYQERQAQPCAEIRHGCLRVRDGGRRGRGIQTNESRH